MTVSLFYKMQNNNNNNTMSKTSSSKKQRPRHQAGTLSAMGSNTSTPCVPTNYTPVEGLSTTEAAATTITTQVTTRNESIEEDSDNRYYTEDLKQECVAPEPRVSASVGGAGPLSQGSPVSVSEISKDWQRYVDGAITPGTGPPNPPPSLVSATSSAQNSDPNQVQSITPTILVGVCIPIDDPCLQLSENVPVPARTDVIARVSREELCQDVAALKDDEESDSFASEEELDMDKKSEYSTADEGDYEMQYRLKVEARTHGAIYEDEDSSEDDDSLDPTTSARTDVTTQRDPCGLTCALLGADSEALRPVLVRQVSEDEEVRVTSDDDDVESSSPVPCNFDTDRDESETERDVKADETVIPIQDSRCDRTLDTATSKPTGSMLQHDRCDGATEPIHWSDEEDKKSGVIIQETMECVPVKCRVSQNLQLVQKQTNEEERFPANYSRWRSLPSLPVIESFDSGKAVRVPSSDVQPLTSHYPTSRSAGQCATPMLPLQSTANLQQVKEFRVRRAMADALTLCEEELGPVALALSQLQEKVRRLNLPELGAQRRPVANLLLDGSSTYLRPAPSLAVSSIVRTNSRMATSMASTRAMCLPAQQQIGWSHPGSTSRISHEADCVCRYCGLQVGTPDTTLSPVARMYILLAQSHRSAHEHEDSACRQPSDRE